MRCTRIGARAFGVLAITALLSVSAATPSLAGDPSPRPSLSKQDRERLAEAAANGASRVTVLFATTAAQTGNVASGVAALGGSVQYTDADLGYVRASVPAGKVDSASKLAGVLGTELDQTYDASLPPVDGGAGVNVLPPGGTTPAENPYMPTRDTGAPQFVKAHPTWDGRGITIGILDTGIDLGHPALKQTSTGQRKIIDWVTFTDPLNDGDPSWVDMSSTVTVAADGTFTVGTRTWTGATPGTYQFGLFREDDPVFADGSAGAEYAIDCSNRAGKSGDLNRNGRCGDVFAFLWNGTDTVWRDSDADMSFAGEAGMKEYKNGFQIGEYGHDDPTTAIRESVPFVTQIDQANKFVSLGIVSGAHGTHVAGIAAGNTLFGSATGAAPGAKIVSIRVCLFISGCTSHALLEGMIYATKTAHVNVVNMSIGGLPSLNDGNNARAILYSRLIDQYKAQLFLSAGNSGPGVNTVGDPSVATKVMSVGAYWSKDSVLANYGNVVPNAEGLHDFSSRGPREDGGFKPDIVAPGNATSSVPTWQGGQCLTDPNCRPGYGMFNGTSMASPQAAGAAALLLSASKATGHDVTPAQLRRAMRTTARFLSGVQAHEQGNGLISVGNAWALLAKVGQGSSNEEEQGGGVFVELLSSVPTNTKLSGFLATPGFGTGIYDREGVTVGSANYTRTYKLRREAGGSRTYTLSWIGNDGTFSTPTTSVRADSSSDTSLVITVRPGAAGVHSAILVLDDPATVGIDFESMNTVIVAIPLNAANSYKATVAGSASKFTAGQPKIFFAVPNGTTAMRMSLNVTNKGRVNATALHPYGVPLTATQAIPFTTGPTATPVTRTLTTGPIPGTWEVVTAASRGAAPDTSTYEITFEAFKVTLAPTSWTQAATIGTPVSQTFTATNEYAAVSTIQTGGAFNSVFTKTTTTPIVAGGPKDMYTVYVRSGTTSVNVSIGAASDPAADLDLLLFFCGAAPSADPEKDCAFAGGGFSSAANESVTVKDPAPGWWMAVVDPYATAGTMYTYSDSLANPAYGSVTVPANVATARAAGATWTFTATGTANASADAGRFLRATVAVRIGSMSGAILGSATVVFTTP
jgi:subtilisin family serine protease